MSKNNLELSRRKILGSVGAVGAAGAAAGLGTSALFSDEESFENNSITAGTLNLTVDARVPDGAINDEWAGAVDFTEYNPGTADGPPGTGVTLGDMKPGDWVLLCYEIEVQDNPACLGLKTENTANDENSVTEPEADTEADLSGSLSNPNTSADTTADIDGEGELAQRLDVTVYDDFDDSVDIGGDLSNAQSALSNELLGGATLQDVWDTFGGGDAIADNVNAFDFYVLLELPTETGNEVQSDSVEWDFVFDAVQSRNTDDDPYGNACEPVWGEGGGGECDCPEENFTPGSTDDDFTNLLSVGPDPDTGFPDIDARIRVDTTAGNANDLTASNFAINETDGGDACGQTIEDVSRETGGAVDIVVVFDDTGSMSGPITDLKNEVNSFTTDLENAGVDARYALVSFKDNAEVDTDFTDASNFQTAVGSLSASGGGDSAEDNVDALAVGTGNAQAQETDFEDPATGGELSDFRSGARRVLIDITDVGAHDETDDRTRFSQSDVEGLLNDGNFSYYAVAPDATGFDVNKRDIADNVDDGEWIEFDSDADLTTVINDITNDLTEEAYVISYTTSCPVEDGTDRTVDVQVDDPDQGLLYEQGSYTAPGS